MTRDYLSVSEASRTIASEVVETGTSKNWNRVDNNTLNLAMELEKNLAKFNIGFVDPNNSSWGTKAGGTRYFSSAVYLGKAKNTLSKFLSSIKK